MRYSILLVCLLAGTAFAFKEHPLDEALIKYEPTLQHFVSAIAEPRGVMVGDLLRARMNLQKAPNPTVLLHDMHTRNLRKEVTTGIPFRVISYNVALLHAKILQVVSVVKSPYNKERGRMLPQLIFEQGFDVVMLQEIWEDHRSNFEKIARSYGYESFYGKDRAYEDGLATFIKKEHVQSPSSIQLRWLPYEEQDPIEYFPGANVKRGFLHVQFNSAQLGSVHIYNTHLQSFRKYWKKRNYQARELGLDLRSHVSDDAVAFVGGDLNAAPYFREDTWIKRSGSRSSSWWKNTIAYATLLFYGDLDDATVMGLPNEDIAIDVTLVDAVQPGAPSCDAPHRLFTATDCNSLNYLQYKGNEPPSRQDHLLLRDKSQRVKITGRGLFFTEKMNFGNGLMIEPSDHYAIFVNALISK